MTAEGLSAPGSRARELEDALERLLRGPLHLGCGELPTNLRFLFYELEDEGIVSKAVRHNPRSGKEKVRKDGQYLSDACSVLRRAERIPWSWVLDETRTLDEWEYASTVYAYITDRVDEARIDAWRGEPPPLIVTEDKATAGVLRRTAAEYLCPIAGLGGQIGLSHVHNDIAPVLERAPRRVLYIGDLDSSGGHIEAALRRELAAAGVWAGEWTRVAITRAQVEERGFSPIVKVDRRYNDGVPYEAWEAEKLGQAVVRSLLTEHLDRLIPEPLDAVRVREQEQRDRLAEMLADLEAEA